MSSICEGIILSSLTFEASINISKKENSMGKSLKPTQIYKMAEERLNQLRSISAEKHKALEKAPAGSIRVVSTPRKIQFYVRNKPSDTNGTYISKTQVSLITRHLQKSYDLKLLKLVDNEIRQLEKLLPKYEPNMLIQQLYSSQPDEVKELIQPVDVTDEDYVQLWLSKTYTSKPILDESTIQITDKGEIVRSKSELNIANALYKKRIPYKYECPLALDNNGLIYPDFTILRPRDRRVMYWEHRGMMDDRDYSRHAVVRTKDYAKSGIHLGINLIITEEISGKPLNTREIDDVINTYLL